jgi:TonB family protein
MTNVRIHERRRMSLSILAAFLFHVLVLIAFLRFRILEKAPDYTGPISVTIAELEVPAPRPEPASRPAAAPRTRSVEARVGQPAKQQRTASKATAMNRPAAPNTAWKRPAPPPTEENPDWLEVKKNLVQVPAEQTVDVAAPALAAPEPVRQVEKKGAFEPGTEITEKPLAFSPQKLDETLGASGAKAGSAPGTGSKAAPGSVSGPTGSPVISWEDASVRRTLLVKPPPPDIPPWVNREGIDLKVDVFFSVTAEGQTILVSTALSSGYTDVDSAVLDVVRKMKFNPAPGAGLAKGTIRYIIRTNQHP